MKNFRSGQVFEATEVHELIKIISQVCTTAGYCSFGSVISNSILFYFLFLSFRYIFIVKMRLIRAFYSLTCALHERSRTFLLAEKKSASSTPRTRPNTYFWSSTRCWAAPAFGSRPAGCFPSANHITHSIHSAALSNNYSGHSARTTITLYTHIGIL